MSHYTDAQRVHALQTALSQSEFSLDLPAIPEMTIKARAERILICANVKRAKLEPRLYRLSWFLSRLSAAVFVAMLIIGEHSH